MLEKKFLTYIAKPVTSCASEIVDFRMLLRLKEEELRMPLLPVGSLLFCVRERLQASREARTGKPLTLYLVLCNC